MNRIKNKELRIKNKEPGFTIIETVLGICIFTIIAIGLIALVSQILTSSNKQTGLLADQDQSRKLAFSITSQLRDAEPSSTGAYPLVDASPQNLIFYSNVDGDALIERLHYYVQDGKLYRGLTKPFGNPLVYNPPGETISVVQNNLANGNTPLFYYYDGSYTGSSTQASLAQPVNVTAVRFIRVDLKVYNKAGLVGNNTFSVSAGAGLRNLKDNLDQGPEGIGVVWQLATQVSPGSTGSVAVSPAGPGYPDDALVNINAYPNLGYAFSSWTGPVNDPASQATTMVMNNDTTITANFTAIPQTLTGVVSNKTGSASSRKWTLKISNSNNYWVNNTNLYSFSLTQTAGPACSPTISVPAAFPALVGDIQSNNNKTYQTTINFGSCQNSTRFTANFTFAGNNGADWGSASITGQAQ